MTAHLEVSVKDFAYQETSPLHYGPLQSLPTTPDLEESTTPSNRYSIIPAPSISHEQQHQESRGSSDEHREDEEEEEEEYHYNAEDLEESELNTKAIALFPFSPENENEIALFEGQEIWINYRYGQGWLVASDLNTGEMGLIPEEYVRLLSDEEQQQQEQQQQQQKTLKPQKKHKEHDDDDEWETEDEEEKGLDERVAELKV